MAPDRFKNGLSPRHFVSFSGHLSLQELQTPEGGAVVMQRLSVFSYAVESRTYRYKGADFYLNRISSGNGARLATANLPLSKCKLASTVIAGALVLAALPALLLVS